MDILLSYPSNGRDFRTNDMENYTLEVGRDKYYSGLRIVFDFTDNFTIMVKRLMRKLFPWLVLRVLRA